MKWKYNTGKWECWNILKILKKYRGYFYKIYFTLKLDVNTLVTQLNKIITDLSKILVTLWIAWIRLFDFDMCHMLGTKYITINNLFQHPCGEREIKKKDINNWIDLKLNIIYVIISKTQEVRNNIFKLKYLKKYYKICIKKNKKQFSK